MKINSYYVLYNPYANSGKCEADARLLTAVYNEELFFIDVTKISNYEVFFSGLASDEGVILCGGDGTLNRFINAIRDIKITAPIYYFPCGTGNDFATDIGYLVGGLPMKINASLENLPIATVNGEDYYFINGVGFGIDGYCAEVGDELRKKGVNKINYTKIAIKGLLGDFKPRKATVTVDGKEYFFNNVWIAPTMKGRFYGGGMMSAPKQNRNSFKKELSLVVFYGKSRLKTLMNFPKIFKGTHVKCENNVKLLKGKNISVEFDKPTSLQIDGETFLNVTKYSVKAE